MDRVEYILLASEEYLRVNCTEMGDLEAYGAARHGSTSKSSLLFPVCFSAKRLHEFSYS